MAKPQSNLPTTNTKSNLFHDGYYWLITASWPRFLSVFAGLFIFTNLFFGFVFFKIGGIGGARPGVFSDAFFFSVHTLATVGYGSMYPAALWTHFAVTAEIMIGLFMTALMTGMIFAKFSRPKAMVLFSNVCLIQKRNGQPVFTFRVANERGNHVAEAQMRVVILKNEVTSEGENMRRMHDAKLERNQSSMFFLSWTVFHPLTSESPIFGMTKEKMESENIQIIATLVGYDPVLGQTIHARHVYLPSDVVWNARYKDALIRLPHNRVHIDYDSFHSWSEQKN